MTKILIANGCSHTAGAEIDPASLFKCYDKAWPKFVADHYGMDYINIAMSGSSNEQIQRSTTIYISKLIAQGQDPSNLFVVVAWSGFDRYEFWDPEKQKHHSFSLLIQQSAYRPADDIMRYIEAKSLIEPENYSNYKSLLYVFQLAIFLERYNIKYCFSNAIRSFELQTKFVGSDNLKREYFELLDLYGRKRIDNHLGFFYKPHVFAEYLKKLPRTNLGGGGHWGEDGQKKYAEFFIQHMGA